MTTSFKFLASCPVCGCGLDTVAKGEVSPRKVVVALQCMAEECGEQYFCEVRLIDIPPLSVGYAGWKGKAA